MKFGSAGARRFAKTATSAMRMITTPPTSAIRWRRKRRQTVLRERGASSAATSAPAFGASPNGADCIMRLAVLHARIEPRVTDVGEQIAEDDEERDDHHVAHQQREVELLQRGDEQPP